MVIREEPCNVCGCKAYDLHDGFFYCTECGTQDVGAQEAVIEYNQIEIGQSSKGKVQKLRTKYTAPEERMPKQWYRWHKLNFLLFNTADELIALGANPSFKDKLLWIWTKYLKEYVKKSHLGLSEIAEDLLKPDIKSDTDTSDSDEDCHNILNKFENARLRKIENHHSLIIAMLYLALNMDRSHIQLSHLLRYIREIKISYPHRLNKIVPQELLNSQKERRHCFDFYTHTNIRSRALTLCKKLKLGCPVVPDIRLIVEEYIEELCLPNDFKHLVFSLMQYYPCDFLDLLVLNKDLNKIPHYELHCMAYILWGLKLCFGLDCDYELKLSKAVDKINERENHPKAYFDSAPNSTGRLFSFREWCAYIHFRMKILQKHCRFFRDSNNLDTDSYVALEQLNDVPDESTKNLTDEIAAEIISKIPGGHAPYGAVPESEFRPSTTPYSSYTRVIAEHLQDPIVKQAISEDFTQYSMRYVTDDFHLVDPYDEIPNNLVTGISSTNKNVINADMHHQNIYKYKQKFVYIKDCDNHNWTKTSRPLANHLVDNESSINSDDDIVQSSDEDSDNFETITDEAADVNIFDDDFTNLCDTKIEFNDGDIGFNSIHDTTLPFEPDDNMTQNVSVLKNDDPPDDDALSATSFDSLDFDTNTFERDKIIKELVHMKCKKYKIRVPPKFKPRVERDPDKPPRTFNRKRSLKVKRQKKADLEKLLAKYYEKSRPDTLQVIQNSVHEIMNNLNDTQFPNIEIDEPMDTSSIINKTEIENEPDFPSKQDLEDDDNNKTSRSVASKSDSDDNLFNESSDGETYGVELIPPKNPKFDEKTYNKKQLYLKVTQPEIPDMELDDSLSLIIEGKINRDTKNPSLLKWKRERVRTKSDSDDDIPLAEIKEQYELYKKISQQNKISLPPYLKNEIKKFKCWFNFYCGTNNKIQRKDTVEELYVHFPKSFKFLVETCASIVDCEIGSLLRALENCEQVALTKSKIKVRKNKSVKFVLSL